MIHRLSLEIADYLFYRKISKKCKKFVALGLMSLVASASIPGSSYADEGDIANLYALASSLGADTDYIAIANYKHSEELPVNNWCYYDYMQHADILENTYEPASGFGQAIAGGSCVGISAVEVLSHNGLISPADVQPGAETLSEVTYSEESDRVITDLQAAQMYNKFALYERNQIRVYSIEQQVGKLLSTAQQRMDEGKYFLITIRSDKMSHAVCGIGVADGSWTYDDVTYDKCILTLDSNATKEDGSAKGFTDKGCIFINSETNKFYIPAYADRLDDSSMLAIIDDSLLNYKGIVGSAVQIPEELDEHIRRLRSISTDAVNSTDAYAVDEDGSMTPLDEMIFRDWVGKATAIEANGFHFELKDEWKSYPNFRYFDTERWIDIEFEKGDWNYLFNAQVDISDNRVKIVNENDDVLSVLFQIRMNDGTYGCEPYFWWDFEANISGDIETECTERGMLLKTDSSISAYVVPHTHEYIEDGIYSSIDILTPGGMYVKSNNNVLVTADDNGVHAFIDDNDDGVYDTQVRQGDANFDGMLDAADASDILSIYAMLSTSDFDKNFYLVCDYNGDGMIDAADASDVLWVYAENSTGFVK